MANVNNYGHVEGRLTKNPRVFVNKDGSKKVMITVAVKRNYKNATTDEVDSDFIEMEGFVRAGIPGLGVFDMISARDRVGIGYTLQSQRYTNSAGQMVYKQVCRIQDVALRETKAEAERHRQMAAAEEAAANADTAVPAAAAQGVLPIVGNEVTFTAEQEEEDIL